MADRALRGIAHHVAKVPFFVTFAAQSFVFAQFDNFSHNKAFMSFAG